MNAGLEAQITGRQALLWRASRLAGGLSQPQRDLLLADDPGPRGIGSWLVLRGLGCLDDAFELTPFGHTVREILRLHHAPLGAVPTDAAATARGLAERHRLVLAADDLSAVAAGTGTWEFLRHLGLLDPVYQPTPLGQAVRDILRGRADGSVSSVCA